MKNQALSLASGFNDPVLENNIKKKHLELKERARKNGKHFAQFNCPHQVGDDILPYIGEIKSSYEKLAADSLLHLQPATHYPEARMEADFAGEKDRNITAAIFRKTKLNQDDTYELENYHPGNIIARIRLVLLCTLIIFFGDFAFNTKAFEITGDSLLFALIISLSISFTVFALTHIAPLIYRNAVTQLKRIIIIISTLSLAIVLFMVLAALRSAFFAQAAVSIKPIDFVIINLFFFVVSSLLSYYFLPCYEEIKEHWIQFRKFQNIRKREKQIAILEKEKEKLKIDILETTKYHMKSANYASYIIRTTQKMFCESVSVFIMTNLIYRSDRTSPDCFKQQIPELHIDYSLISSANLNSKQ